MEELSSPLVSVMAFLVGLCFGSFGNVLIARLPEDRSILGRSRCMACNAMIAIHDLVPIFSFAWLRGHCRSCDARISLRYPLIELTSGLLAIIVLRTVPNLTEAVTSFFALWLLLLIAVIDGTTQRIPDQLNLPFIALGVATAVLHGSVDLVAILFAPAFFGAQWLLSRGTAIGSGDVLLGIGCGALLGSLPLVIAFLLLTYIAGGLVAGYLLITKRATRETRLPFAPFIAIGTVGALLI